MKLFILNAHDTCNYEKELHKLWQLEKQLHDMCSEHLYKIEVRTAYRVAGTTVFYADHEFAHKYVKPMRNGDAWEDAANAAKCVYIEDAFPDAEITYLRK